jgi:DNA-binding transcriptional regulator YhcF (GntR family)
VERNGWTAALPLAWSAARCGGFRLLDKRRGIGMFVAAGARATLLARRRAEFTTRYVEPLLTEATRLGIDADKLIVLIKEVSNEREGASL